MIKFRKENEEVLFPIEDAVAIKRLDLQELRSLSLLNKRKRIRICAHMNPSDKLHDMIIVHGKECYVRPHKHETKSESITILEGEADLILFEEDGSIRGVISMGEVKTNKAFFYRISNSIYHMLIIRSKFLTFHEATEGPFDREDTKFPEWSPTEDSDTLVDFISSIENGIRNNSLK